MREPTQTAVVESSFDPRLKLAVTLVYAVCVVTTPASAAPALVAYGALLAGALLVHHRRARAVARRVARSLPIVAALVLLLPWFKVGRPLWTWGRLTVSAEGMEAAAMLAVYGLYCLGAFALLMETTREAELLTALRGIGVPSLFAGVIASLLRYLHVLPREMRCLRDARDARTVGPGGPSRLRSSAALVGSLFVRSADRAQRVADAMAARGFQGRLHVPPRPAPRAAHVVGGILAILVLVAIRLGGQQLHV